MHKTKCEKKKQVSSAGTGYIMPVTAEIQRQKHAGGFLKFSQVDVLVTNQPL